MIIKRILNYTRVFGAPPDWNGEDMSCQPLCVKDVMTQEGVFMVSAWEPSPAEIKAILVGESIKLWIRGSAHPVVSLTVGPIE